MKKSVVATLAIITLFFGGCSGNPQARENGSNDSATSSGQSSQTSSVQTVSWTRVDKQAFWQKSSFFDHSYNFPNIAFEYPSNWKFHCCGDMDHASEHLICPNDAIDDKSNAYVGNFRDKCGKDYVLITDYALAGCPSGRQDCSIDQQVPKTAQQKYDELVNSIRANPDMQILHADYAPGLRKDVFRYENNDHVRSYLINLGDDVIEIAFTQNLVMNGNFVDEFLSRVTWDKK